MSILPKPFHAGILFFIIFVGWGSCLGRGPQEVANHSLGLPMGWGADRVSLPQQAFFLATCMCWGGVACSALVWLKPQS